MDINFNDALYDKIHGYCKVVTYQILKKTDKSTLYLAKEACHIVLEDLWRKRDSYFKDRELTDNLLFITCRNKTTDYINQQFNTRKREIWLDKHSINIDSPTEGNDFTIELLDEDTEEGFVEQKQQYDDRQEELLKKIYDVLSSKEVKNKEKQIFLDFYLHRLTYATIMKKRKCTQNYVASSLKKIRNILKYEFKLDQGVITVLRNFKNMKRKIK